MIWYVYILKSLKDGTYYKGMSEDYLARFEAHNKGESNYTSARTPWELIYVEVHQTKKEALMRERKLKRCKGNYFEWLRHQETNILH